MTEQRITNSQTGGEKGQKLARFDLVPVGPLTQLAEHYGRGAEKYEDRNWEKGIDWSLNYAALIRHVTAWWAGEDLDEDTGSTHMAAVAWHAFALMEYAHTHPELDNRPRKDDGQWLGWEDVDHVAGTRKWRPPTWRGPAAKLDQYKRDADQTLLAHAFEDEDINTYRDEFGYVSPIKTEGTYYE